MMTPDGLCIHASKPELSFRPSVPERVPLVRDTDGRAIVAKKSKISPVGSLAY